LVPVTARGHCPPQADSQNSKYENISEV
jgi:hypothetical protein